MPQPLAHAKNYELLDRERERERVIFIKKERKKERKTERKKNRLPSS